MLKNPDQVRPLQTLAFQRFRDIVYSVQGSIFKLVGSLGDKDTAVHNWTYKIR